MLLHRLHRPSLGLRRVDHAVGIQRHQRVDVVRGDHPRGLPQTTQLGGVAAHLAGAGRVQTDQLEVGALDDGAQCVDAHIAGRELDDPPCHGVSFKQKVGDGLEARVIQHAGQHAAIDFNGGAVDEIGGARGEEHTRPADLLGFATAAQGTLTK